MKRLLQRLWKEETIRTITILIIGALFGKFIDSFSVPNVPVPAWVFFGFSGVAFLVLSLAFLALRNDTRKLIEKSSISFEVVEEKIGGDGFVAGAVYSKLADLVGSAEREILVFNYPRRARVKALDSESPKMMPSKQKRREWLEAELKTLHEYLNRTFKYVMIIQSPEQQAQLVDIVDTDIANSLREVLSLQAKNRSPNYVVDVRRANTEFVNPFMIVDERFLTVPLYGIREGAMYIDKIFVFEDREGQLIRTFKAYFESMERKAARVTAQELVVDD